MGTKTPNSLGYHMPAKWESHHPFHIGIGELIVIKIY